MRTSRNSLNVEQGEREMLKVLKSKGYYDGLVKSCDDDDFNLSLALTKIIECDEDVENKFLTEAHEMYLKFVCVHKLSWIRLQIHSIKNLNVCWIIC